MCCLGNKGLKLIALVITLGLFIAGAIVSWVASGRMPIDLQPSFEGQQVTTMFSLDPGSCTDAFIHRIRAVPALYSAGNRSG